MTDHRWTAIVTIVALLVYVRLIFQVGSARGKSGIKAPEMTGDPMLERAIRVQANMLEGLPMFLCGIWLFAIYWNEQAAAALGAVWVVGRVLYSLAYMADPAKRGMGFMIQGLAGLALLLGALGKIILDMVTAGA